jgi:hypothetical protein
MGAALLEVTNHGDFRNGTTYPSHCETHTNSDGRHLSV